MKYKIHPLHDLLHKDGIPKIARVDFQRPLNTGQILAFPSREIVKDAHMIAALQQCTHQVRSDKTCTTSNQCIGHITALENQTLSMVSAAKL